MIVGLLSTYREGRLAADAARSLLPCCDRILVQEGPIGDVHSDGDEFTSRLLTAAERQRVFVQTGIHASDADKRSQLLERTRSFPPPVWAVVVDADELLLWGEHLPAMIDWAERNDPNVLSFGIRIVELDGACALVASRVLRADRVERYTLSSHMLLTRSGVEVSLPNVPLLLAGQPDEARTCPLAPSVQLRRPLHGESHILHRSLLRDPGRHVRRLHKQEADDLSALGLDGSRMLEPSPGVPIWLPK